MYTHLEDYITDLYGCLAIEQPDQLNVTDLSQKLKVKIYYSSVSFRVGRNIVIKRSNKRREWQSFGHEIGHYLRHYGNQLRMHRLFIDLQEYQANHFAYHFCVPTFMLCDINDLSVYKIMDLFNVEYEFAYRRLEMHQNKLLMIR